MFKLRDAVLVNFIQFILKFVWRLVGCNLFAMFYARQQMYLFNAEFILLFEYNISKRLLSYWKFEVFELDSWNAA